MKLIRKCIKYSLLNFSQSNFLKATKYNLNSIPDIIIIEKHTTIKSRNLIKILLTRKSTLSGLFDDVLIGSFDIVKSTTDRLLLLLSFFPIPFKRSLYWKYLKLKYVSYGLHLYTIKVFELLTIHMTNFLLKKIHTNDYVILVCKFYFKL